MRFATVAALLAAWAMAGASAGEKADGDTPADATGAAGAAGKLKVHLPRAEQVQAGPLTVGEVCILFGDDDKTVAAAEKVRLGRAPFSREKMQIDRDLILGRLAANGFDRRQIRFSGAKHVIVTLDQRQIDTSRIVAAASALLDKKHPPADESRWRLTGQVEPVLVEPGPDARLAPAIAAATETRASVRVGVVRDGEAETQRVLTFVKEHLWRQAVARRDLARGQAVTDTDVAVETLYRPTPQANWEAPEGKLAARAIPAGTVIPPNLLTAPRPAVVFKRNAVVRIRADLGGFTLTAKGLALREGRVGQTVPVQNIDSKRILTARVRADGAVEPLLEETRE